MMSESPILLIDAQPRWWTLPGSYIDMPEPRCYLYAEEQSAAGELLYASLTWYDHQDRVRFSAEYGSNGATGLTLLRNPPSNTR